MEMYEYCLQYCPQQCAFLYLHCGHLGYIGCIFLWGTSEVTSANCYGSFMIVIHRCCFVDFVYFQLFNAIFLVLFTVKLCFYIARTTFKSLLCIVFVTINQLLIISCMLRYHSMEFSVLFPFAPALCFCCHGDVLSIILWPLPLPLLQPTDGSSFSAH